MIATANDPLALDSAVLKRPGRFDRVVHFPNPSSQLRRDYFIKMHSESITRGWPLQSQNLMGCPSPNFARPTFWLDNSHSWAEATFPPRDC